MTKITNSNNKKITNEKPVSLSPLKFKDALAAFMKVKPATKEEMDKVIKEKEDKENPSK